MTVPAQHGPPVGRREARRAWVFVGLMPLGWVVGFIPLLFIGLAEDPYLGHQPADPALWLLFEALWLAAPTVAVISAIRAARAGNRSGRIALGVAGVLLLATMAFFVMAAVNGHAQITVSIAGVAVAAAVGLFGWFPRSNLLPPGLEQRLNRPGTYWADLTTGHGDFPAITTGNTTASYLPDGFHLRFTQAGGFRPAAITIPKSCTAARVTATVTEVSSPTGAGFGPWCFDALSNGYGMALASDGHVTITHLENGNPAVIGSGHAAAWLPGQTKDLAIVCQLGDTGDKVSAFVNGAKVADAASQSPMPAIKATGFAATVPEAAAGPGEWAVIVFSRDAPGGD